MRTRSLGRVSAGHPAQMLRISGGHHRVTRSDAPPLLPILRSRHQADLLAVLLLHPDRAYTLIDLAGTDDQFASAKRRLPGE